MSGELYYKCERFGKGPHIHYKDMKWDMLHPLRHRYTLIPNWRPFYKPFTLQKFPSASKRCPQLMRVSLERYTFQRFPTFHSFGLKLGKVPDIRALCTCPAPHCQIASKGVKYKLPNTITLANTFRLWGKVT